MSLASLGDIDRDGYGDFVVGAPYGGLRGHGAVYIYHGSSTGVLEKYSQVIYAENLDVPVNTFGFSVSGGLDLDGNRYPDLVVGAYESATAIFFRSRPVIKMDSYVSFDLESKLISLDDRNCTLSDGSRVTCFPLRACFKYSGEGVFSRHNFNIQYALDVKKTKSPRLFFLELEGRNMMNRTIMVDRERQFCRTVQVRLNHFTCFLANNFYRLIGELDWKFSSSTTKTFQALFNQKKKKSKRRDRILFVTFSVIVVQSFDSSDLINQNPFHHS